MRGDLRLFAFHSAVSKMSIGVVLPKAISALLWVAGSQTWCLWLTGSRHLLKCAGDRPMIHLFDSGSPGPTLFG